MKTYNRLVFICLLVLLDRYSNAQGCELNGKLTAEERMGISFFQYAKKIQVISFSNNEVKATPIDKHFVAYKYTRDSITLSKGQIDSLTEILYNYNYPENLLSYGVTRGSCYNPRHAIVFLNSSDKVMGYFEFCLECRNRQTFPANENAGVFCDGKFDLLKTYFENIGITFFEEDKEE